MNETTEVNRHEQSLRNTFGWMRIEILTMLIAGIFLGAFCFSLVVEAVQTLIHIDHQDAMHLPIAVFTLSIFGLFLNVFCFVTIGGYTYHQGSFLHITSTGDVVLDQMAGDDAGLCRLSKNKRNEIINQSNGAIQSIASSIQIDVSSLSMPAKTMDQTVQITPHKHTIGELMRDISSA